jgi:hypothetical protein
MMNHNQCEVEEKHIERQEDSTSTYLVMHYFLPQSRPHNPYRIELNLVLTDYYQVIDNQHYL